LTSESFRWPIHFVQEIYPKFPSTSDACSRVKRHVMS